MEYFISAQYTSNEYIQLCITFFCKVVCMNYTFYFSTNHFKWISKPLWHYMPHCTYSQQQETTISKGKCYRNRLILAFYTFPLICCINFFEILIISIIDLQLYWFGLCYQYIIILWNKAIIQYIYIDMYTML